MSKEKNYLDKLVGVLPLVAVAMVVIISIIMLYLVVRFLWTVPSALLRIASAVEEIADSSGEQRELKSE